MNEYLLSALGGVAGGVAAVLGCLARRWPSNNKVMRRLVLHGLGGGLVGMCIGPMFGQEPADRLIGLSFLLGASWGTVLDVAHGITTGLIRATILAAKANDQSSGEED